MQTRAVGLRGMARPQRLSNGHAYRDSTFHCSACHRRTQGPAQPTTGAVISKALERLGQSALGLAAALALSGAPAIAEAQVLTFPVAPDPKVFSVQRTIVEAWTIVTESFVDPLFNGKDWTEELTKAVVEASEASTPEEAQRQLTGMLGTLDDPFTRWVPAKAYEDFRVSADGEIQGVGLLIAADPSSGRLVVLAPIKGSPADKAGILPGDQVLSVDGNSTEGWDNEKVSSYLRGSEGSAVVVEVGRPREQIPGMAGDRLSDEEMERKRFRLQRARLEFSPVFATPMNFDGHTFGYVRLVSFSQKAAVEMQKAIVQLKRDGAEAFILDLRNNPGGLVSSSLDIAGLWMDGSAHPTIFNIEERDSAGSSQLASVQLDGGRAVTDLPMVVLVNKQSASASEILAAALHDNSRAVVLGEPTFGKGKIQSVFELGDGSALFVTVAKYRTPLGLEIDRVGVQPDRACSPLGPESPSAVPGIPVGPGASELVLSELESDDCVLTAQSLLEKTVDDSASMRAHRALSKAPGLRFGA